MGGVRCSPLTMQLRLLLLGGILVPVLGSAQPPLEPPLRPLCRSDNAFGGDAGCDPALAFLDRGDAAFWTTEYAKTWRHFELPARANVGASRSGTTATDRAGKIEAALDTLAGSLYVSACTNPTPPSPPPPPPPPRRVRVATT